MKLHTRDEISVKVIGGGGIGTCLLPPLCKLLEYGSKDIFISEVNVTLVDGDEFESRNESRQFFDKIGNKAEVKVEELKKLYDNVNFGVISEYISNENASDVIAEKDVVFLCVDNHTTRKLVSQHCSTLNDVMLISGGNGYEDGDVLIYHRMNGKDITAPLHSESLYPEIANPDDEHPNDIEERSGCEQQVQSAPQLILANNTAASLMANSFYSFMNGVFDPDDETGFPHVYDRIFFDAKTGGFKKYNYSNVDAVNIINKKKIEAIKAKKRK